MNYNTIQNALTVEEIEGIHSFLTVDSPSSWWAYTASHTNTDGFNVTDEVHQIFPNNKGERDIMQLNASASYRYGHPCYNYSKQMGNYSGKWAYHQEGCECFICDSNKNGIFKPGGKLEELASGCAVKGLQLESLEWARYQAGNFYGRRELQGNQYGFSLSITKDWNPLWGGTLVGWKADDQFFHLPQDYNSLVVWDGTTAITPVIPNLANDLYVLTGTLRKIA